MSAREQRAERLTVLRGREAARKVCLRGAPLMDLPLERRIAFAIYDPGAITPRGDDYREPLYVWQARAVSYVLTGQGSQATAGESTQLAGQQVAGAVLDDVTNGGGAE